VIRYRGFAPSARAPLAEAIVRDLWRQLGPTDSTIAVAVVVYNGTLHQIPTQRWRSYVGAWIAPRDGGLSCVAVLPGFSVRHDTIQVGGERTGEALAPCLLLAGFGPPGAALASWLTASRYGLAQSTAWLNRSRSYIDGWSAPPWKGHSDYAVQVPGEGSRSFLLSSGIGRWISGLIAPPYELGQAGLRCLDGNLPACRATILDTVWIAERTREIPSDLTSAGWLARDSASSLLIPSPPGHWWLSDLIRDQGREKFARFWKSDLSFEQAFHAAFGEELGAWTRRWALRQWENSWEGKYRRQPRLLGVTLTPSWPLLALGWTGVMLLVTVLVARGRRAI
jgi:hypothetical protein